MIDGIIIKYKIIDFTDFRKRTNISFQIKIDEETGDIFTSTRDDKTVITHWAKFETYDLIVKEVMIRCQTQFYLTIKGSLHKNYYDGKNYSPFTWLKLQQEIDHLCKELFIDAGQAKISNLEVGVNIDTPFNVTEFINDSIINYKGQQFDRYKKDGKGISLGIYCKRTQYSVKIYDKGLQHSRPQNLMRIEKRFVKMQELNRLGIHFISDLSIFKNVFDLLPILSKMWLDVLIYDIVDLKVLRGNLLITSEENELLQEGQNPKYWTRLKNMDRRKCNYHREKFRNLIEKHGEHLHTEVSNLIAKEWEYLFEN